MGSYLFIQRARSVKKKKRFVLLFNWIPVESSVPWKAGLLTSVVLQALEKEPACHARDPGSIPG